MSANPTQASSSDSLLFCITHTQFAVCSELSAGEASAVYIMSREPGTISVLVSFPLAAEVANSN